MKLKLLLLFILFTSVTNAQDSIHKEYYSNGALLSETPFVKGKANGIERIYMGNGILKSGAKWVNGVVFSKNVNFTMSGQIRSYGIRVRTWKIELFGNGKVIQSMQTDSTGIFHFFGVPAGTVYSLDAKYTHTISTADKNNPDFELYDSTGRQVLFTHSYGIAECNFNVWADLTAMPEIGKIRDKTNPLPSKNTAPLVYNTKDSVHKEYYPSGNLKSITPLIKGVANGIQKTYYDLSYKRIKDEIPFVNGKENGMQRTYTGSENLKSETVWINGVIVSIKTKFTMTGKLGYEEKGHWHPLPNIKLQLEDSKEKFVEAGQTDSLGVFHFTNVAGGQYYFVNSNYDSTHNDFISIGTFSSSQGIWDSTGRKVANIGQYFQADLTCMPEQTGSKRKSAPQEKLTQTNSSGPLVYNTKDSVHKEYYPSGNLKSITPLVKGVANGTQKIYFDVVGKRLLDETPFVRGKENGIQRIYVGNGALKSETTWVDGTIVTKKTTFTMTGKLLYPKDINAPNNWCPMPNVKLRLVSEQNQNYTVLSVTKTDSSGVFHFSKVDGRQFYILSIKYDDFKSIYKTKENLNFFLEITDSTGKRVVTLMGNQSYSGGDCSSSADIQADLTCMPVSTGAIATKKNINISGNLLLADGSGPLSNTIIKLVNDKGQVIQTCITNAFGTFVFTALPPDKTFSFRVDNEDSKLSPLCKVILTDKSGNILKSFVTGNNGKFHFEILPSDTVAMQHMTLEDTQLKLQLGGKILSDKKTPVSFVKVNLYNSDGTLVQTVITNASGDFVFTSLPPDQNYTFKIDAEDSKLGKMGKLFLADSKGNTHEFILKNGVFKFELLPADKIAMGKMYADDPWVVALNLKNSGGKKDSLNIFESIYYDYQKWDIMPAAERVLDKVIMVLKNDDKIKVQLNAYTDPRGTDEFNLELSQKRADAAVSYIVSHGISSDKIIGKGCGKAQQVGNSYSADANNTESQYAVNRHTEFRLVRTTE